MFHFLVLKNRLVLSLPYTQEKRYLVDLIKYEDMRENIFADSKTYNKKQKEIFVKKITRHLLDVPRNDDLAVKLFISICKCVGNFDVLGEKKNGKYNIFLETKFTYNNGADDKIESIFESFFIKTSKA